MERPYRIPIPNWAAFLVVTPPTIGILAIFLLGNWYVNIFSVVSIGLGLALTKLGGSSEKLCCCKQELDGKNRRFDSPLSDEDGERSGDVSDFAIDDGGKSAYSPLSFEDRDNENSFDAETEL